MGAANSSFYSDFAIQPIDNAVIGALTTIFQQIFYFGGWIDDFIAIWTGDVDKVNLLLEFINLLDNNLKVTVKISDISLWC